MEEFSLRNSLIPELLKMKIDFRILRYKNGDKRLPVSLIVFYKYHNICKVNCDFVRTSISDCYHIEWCSKHMTGFNPNKNYARAFDLVHDICRAIDFKQDEENRGEKKMYRVTDVEYGVFTSWRNEYEKERDKFDIKDVIFNNPATIVFWEDGTKTVVKAENEEFDPEKGLAMAIAKKALGNNYDYYDIFKKYVGRYEKKQKKGEK